MEWLHFKLNLGIIALYKVNHDWVVRIGWRYVRIEEQTTNLTLYKTFEEARQDCYPF